MTQNKRPVAAEKLKRLVEIIEEFEGCRCPTDKELATRLGYAYSTSASSVVRRAVDDGLLVSIGNRRNRRLRVVTTGKTTGPSRGGKL